MLHQLRTAGGAGAGECDQEALRTPAQVVRASPAQRAVFRPAAAMPWQAAATAHLQRLLLPGRNTVLLHEREQRLLVRPQKRQAVQCRLAAPRLTLTCGSGSPCAHDVRQRHRRRTACNDAPLSGTAQPASVVRRIPESGPLAVQTRRETRLACAARDASCTPRPEHRGDRV